ncbi:hypothetical protein [Streptomyces sp. TRM68416]|uniref:hypothetical protein n=1 Tax=Streptomyces sp. TRM68416 TaxID=2758412 RepID=UPI001661DB07|nr:hypothetical protein [Streptomyces sp. TRM68416]MBD0837374.1 hypothetical protein [Streptomyces sp. TRM68416]
MARIRVLQGISGAAFSWAPGELVDLPDDEAAVWVDGERAELVDDEEPGAQAAPSVVHQQPQVVGEDGQELEVLAATVEDIEPPAGAEDAGRWVRWQVTVRLPPFTPPAADDGPYDPSQHPIKDVLAYLQDAGEEEAMRVLHLEDGAETPRKGITGQRQEILERARANDRERAEKAAEASRGGGRGDGMETR